MVISGFAEAAVHSLSEGEASQPAISMFRTGTAVHSLPEGKAGWTVHQ